MTTRWAAAHLRRYFPSLLILSGAIYSLPVWSKNSSRPVRPAPPAEVTVALKLKITTEDHRTLQASALGIDLAFPTQPLQLPFRLTLQGNLVKGQLRCPMLDGPRQIVVHYPGYSPCTRRVDSSTNLDLAAIHLILLEPTRQSRVGVLPSASPGLGLGRPAQAILPHHRFRSAPTEPNWGSHLRKGH
jgi:hypothetical protein